MLRIYCETLPYEEVVRPRTLALLRRHDLAIVLAVRPWQLAELPRVARVLRDGGVLVSVWPMLADDEGRWASAHNAPSFVRFIRETIDVLEAAAVRPSELLLDLEPPFAQARALAATGGSEGRSVGRGRATPAASPAAMDAASLALAGAVADLHARGVATASAVWPLVALDAPGDRAGSPSSARRSTRSRPTA